MRVLLKAVPTAVVLLALSAGAVGAVQGAFVTEASEDSIELSFVDAASDRRSSPLINVRNAYPGMPVHTADVGVRNWGAAAASYDLVVLPADPGPSALTEVLILTIRSGAHGKVVYRGSVAGAAFTSARPLPPGAADHYRFSFRWDSGGAGDNSYQGQASTFRLEARGRQAS